MTVSSLIDAGDVISSEIEAPLLNNGLVKNSVDFKNRPANRLTTGGWKSASFIVGVEVAERFAYFGISSNLISYLTGPLGQSTATAAENVNIWSGTAMLLPLVGAFIADSFIGWYRMITFATLLYILSLGLLSLSASVQPSSLHHCKNGESNLVACSTIHDLKSIIFFFSLYLVAIAQGAHKPCVQAFGADQFDEEDPKEFKARSSFFNWWFFALSIGFLAATLVLSYIQDNMSWELGFGIPCIIMLLSLIVFLFGSTTYRYRLDTAKRNPFVRIGHVYVNAVINWRSDPITMYLEEDEDQAVMPLENTKLNFLDKALYTRYGSKEEDVCSITDVEDAKAILRLIPIWVTSLGYAIVISQGSTLFTKQGATLDRHITSTLQLSSASLQCLTGLCVLAFIPIYDRILVPITRAITKKPGGISMLQRIGSGIFMCFIMMVIAALVEMKRLSIANEYESVTRTNAAIPMSVWWLAPQYLFSGVASACTMVGLQEFFYDQVPKDLKSIGLALYLSILGFGSFLSSFIISIVEKVTSAQGRESWFSDDINRAHLDYFYWLLAGIGAVSFFGYVYFAKTYVYNRKL